MLYLDDKGFEREIGKLEKKLREFASQMKFEEAAELRDRTLRLRRDRLMDTFGAVPATGPVE